MKQHSTISKEGLLIPPTNSLDDMHRTEFSIDAIGDCTFPEMLCLNTPRPLLQKAIFCCCVSKYPASKDRSNALKGGNTNQGILSD